MKHLKPLSDFSEFKAEYPLAQELPYWDFLNDQNLGECVILADGSLVKGLSLSGIDLETKTTEEVNTLCANLRGFLNALLACSPKLDPVKRDCDRNKGRRKNEKAEIYAGRGNTKNERS